MALSMLDTTVWIVAFALAAWVCTKRTRNKLPHPPGPPGLPIVGNLLDMPGNPAWHTYLRWSQQYNSDLVRLNVLGSNILVANTLEAVSDLLEKRSANYSDRDGMTMLNELCGYGWGLAFQRYDGPWRDARRLLRQEFNIEAVKKYRPIEEKASYLLLRNLLEKPNDPLSHLRHMAGAEIMEISYGIDVKPHDDPYILTAEHAVESISATTNAGSYLVDVLPILKYVPEWFPGAGFQKEARLWKASVVEMLHRPFNVVKSKIAAGEARECAMTSIMESEAYRNSNDKTYMEDVLRSAIGSMYTGGADTTVSALGSFFLAMVLYPEVQLKAQAQIDSVCAGRLPNFSDFSSLPYVEAIVKEALRWHPVVPLDVPHRSTGDDIYNGYFIPAGSLVVANTWAILHDEEIYPEPLRFNPDRFMKNGELSPDVRDPRVAAFGFGRRVCVGRHMAYESMWMAIASTLAVFDIEKVKDKHGVPITPKEDYHEGFLCYPKPFLCIVKPRSVEHRTLIELTAGNL